MQNDNNQQEETDENGDQTDTISYVQHEKVDQPEESYTEQ